MLIMSLGKVRRCSLESDREEEKRGDHEELDSFIWRYSAGRGPWLAWRQYFDMDRGILKNKRLQFIHLPLLLIPSKLSLCGIYASPFSSSASPFISPLYYLSLHLPTDAAEGKDELWCVLKHRLPGRLI